MCKNLSFSVSVCKRKGLHLSSLVSIISSVVFSMKEKEGKKRTFFVLVCLPDGVRFLSLRFFFFLLLCIHLASFSDPPYSSIYGNYVAEDQKEFFFPVLVLRGTSSTAVPTKTRGNLGWKGPVGLAFVLLPRQDLPARCHRQHACCLRVK